MPKFRVPITRDCTFTQTTLVVVEAVDKAEALEKALSLTQDEILDLPDGWATDDDDSFHYGEETGTYCPDEDAIEQMG